MSKTCPECGKHETCALLDHKRCIRCYVVEREREDEEYEARQEREDDYRYDLWSDR